MENEKEQQEFNLTERISELYTPTEAEKKRLYRGGEFRAFKEMCFNKGAMIFANRLPRQFFYSNVIMDLDSMIFSLVRTGVASEEEGKKVLPNWLNGFHSIRYSLTGPATKGFFNLWKDISFRKLKSADGSRVAYEIDYSPQYYGD